jgi:hypothetical protein
MEEALTHLLVNGRMLSRAYETTFLLEMLTYDGWIQLLFRGWICAHPRMRVAYSAGYSGSDEVFLTDPTEQVTLIGGREQVTFRSAAFFRLFDDGRGQKKISMPILLFPLLLPLFGA